MGGETLIYETFSKSLWKLDIMRKISMDLENILHQNELILYIHLSTHVLKSPPIFKAYFLEYTCALYWALCQDLGAGS